MSKKLKGLMDRSVEISDIVDTVKKIATQTNRLALSATIEASIAGEVGSRFGAVAVEIRKLADRASESTREVTNLIKATQTETQDAVVAMEQGIERVETGYQVAREASERLREIATISLESASFAQDISIATQRQVQGTGGVARAVQSIAGVAVQTEQSAVRMRTTVGSLAQLAEQLRSKLSRFKVAGA